MIRSMLETLDDVTTRMITIDGLEFYLCVCEKETERHEEDFVIRNSYSI